MTYHAPPPESLTPERDQLALQTVAVLCVSRRSVYKSLPGVEAFDVDRDARTFGGGMPVVAHPPCRTWSAYCRQLVKATPEERAREQSLGLWCVEQVRECGGIVEQPAHSHLWQAAGLPRPGDTAIVASWSLEVWQAWWGYPVKKATWLYFAGIKPDDVELPMRLHSKGRDRRAVQLMSHRQRSATCPAFAMWLVDLARRAT
jgi:hypothetical protein